MHLHNYLYMHVGLLSIYKDPTMDFEENPKIGSSAELTLLVSGDLLLASHKHATAAWRLLSISTVC